MTQEDPLLIADRKVDPRLLRQSYTQRCSIDECLSWCCTGGVWVDLGERDKILANADRVRPLLPAERGDESQWFDGEREAHPDYPSGWGEGTAVVDDPTHPAGQTCVFLRPEDRRCALQAASLANDENPWGLKPFFCTLHPLTLDNGTIILDDESEMYIEGGHCQRPSGQAAPIYVTFRLELEFVLGRRGYQELVERAMR